MRRTHILAVLDGWGIGSPDASNPIHVAEPRTIRMLETTFPCCALQASGITVGLPWGEEGNSEVGHMTLGAGTVLYQHYPRISLAIRDGSFFKNIALVRAFTHALTTHATVHLVGLLTEGNVHASFEHLTALLTLAKQSGVQECFIHLITDGRDGPPHGSATLIAQLEKEIALRGIGTIASIVGRFYAMDRDGHYDRTERAYKLIVDGAGKRQSVREALDATYARGNDDDMVEPTIVGEPHPISQNDSLIFFNFREDSINQLALACANDSFTAFNRTHTPALTVTFTEYGAHNPETVAFPTPAITHPFGAVLAQANRTQLRVAETEKYAHVTRFFNGLREDPFPNEYRVLIPSENVQRYDEHPAMMARTITDRVLSALTEHSFDFILVNYANPDMVAHTGNFDATVQAIRTVDEELERLVKATLEGDHRLIITADHGNAEHVFDAITGATETQHNTSAVPCYFVAPEYARTTPLQEPRTLESVGFLSDVAPTLLTMMELPIPATMTGQDLVDHLSTH